ncbi:D-TA family PLP-dependent enzyme [Emticicia sp. TH156]|uniref:D-TA family PLP-dependent enzyme n=1 Tax=Emticicia sp. TH156 TaxID=2067454 RepID=UPI000C7740DE|nr:D-TA family PLP-dependent enzyme [Emticicia sp. TH156]PLK43049.1 alanine racemase [Emticicia sp. TH156]
MDWYKVNNEGELDSPSLLIYKERVQENVRKMIDIAGNADRLFTHVKTNKMPEIVKLMIAQGISKFKCATIAEAEITAMAGAGMVVIAHQLVGPKIGRLVQLSRLYPDVVFASLIDSLDVAKQHNEVFEEAGLVSNVFLDVNNGMDRSGHLLDDKILDLYTFLASQSHIKLLGLHIYDGHLRADDFEERKHEIDAGFVDVKHFLEAIEEKGLPKPMVIAGGTPAFTSHALRAETFCSPGTCVLWDWGYGDKLTEQPFEYAALVLTRVISKPQKGIVTIDMGHKAISAENPIDKRVRFLNLTDYELTGQSEEHGVLKVKNWNSIKVGDVLYGVPYHVCPTVNLYDEAYVVANQQVNDVWQVLGRRRKVTV